MNVMEWLKAAMNQHAPEAGGKQGMKSTGLDIPPYAMAMQGTDSAEITLYGNIVSKRPMNYWTGQPEEGNFIILSEVLQDLNKLQSVGNLTIRIHSLGGNAYDAVTIHNRLKQLTAHKTVIVDGVAMSGGSLIMCAGDTVKVHKSSLIMIHRGMLQLWDDYTCTQLRNQADKLDTVDRMQAAIYKEQTGKSEEEILALMDKTTYMTGEEAIDMGFADELIDCEQPEIAASEDRKTLFVGGLPVFVSGDADGIPRTLPIPTISTAAQPAVGIQTQTMPAPSGNDEGGHEPMANTTEELRAAYPDLVAEIEAAAKGNPQAAAQSAAAPNAGADATAQAVASAPAEAERERLRAIDEIAPSVMDAQMVHDAKYGESPMTAEALALAAMQKNAKLGSDHLKARSTETQASGAAGVTPAAPSQDTTPKTGDESPQAMEAQAKADLERYLKMKGGN